MYVCRRVIKIVEEEGRLMSRTALRKLLCALLPSDEDLMTYELVSMFTIKCGHFLEAPSERR
jgi:hypothetical protein